MVREYPPCEVQRCGCVLLRPSTGEHPERGTAKEKAVFWGFPLIEYKVLEPGRFFTERSYMRLS